MNIRELFDPALLDGMLRERYVIARKHPSCALTILNYGEKATFDRVWNSVTLQCRGIIHDDEGNVLARPFRKFFNYGQPEVGELDLSAPVVCTDKLDGSLGILYRREVGWAIATRGSFDSEQAHHGTRVWWDKYNDVAVPVGFTLLFEIVYPGNRIVCDYGEHDDLILLGAVNIETGRSVDPYNPILSTWPGPRAEIFPYATLADALTATPRPNAEGLVVHFTVRDERVKLKQEDYVALHRIVTGLNERTVWDHLVAGKPLDELIEPLPDEFHDWVREVAARLLATVESGCSEVETAYSAILASLPPEHSRKDFAMLAKDHARRAQLFARHDGKDYRRQVWDECYPEPRVGPRVMHSEATA